MPVQRVTFAGKPIREISLMLFNSLS